jgi:tRNA threonylcarbamoyladenosine biosynthesis protein TsaB
MKILALEFSSARRSVALVQRADHRKNSVLLATASDEAARLAGPLRLVQAALENAQVLPHQVEALAVGLGPGSYTGVRSALSVAQGWQLARGVNVFGVSTVDCLAAQAQAQGWFGRVRVVIDAQRCEVYVSTFQVTLEACVIVEPLRIVPLSAAQADQDQPDLLFVGPEAEKWFPRARTLSPDAATVALLAQLEKGQSMAEHLEPFYLREPRFVKAPRLPHQPC